MSEQKLRIVQVRSANGSRAKQRATLRALGLGRIGKATEHPDSAPLRGQIRAVEHFVEVSRQG